MNRKTIRQYDTCRLDKARVTPQGFLKVDVFGARTGIQIYRKRDGSQLREFRPPEEVFKADSMGSFRNAPVTNDHPQDMINIDNAKDLMVGFLSDTVQRVDGEPHSFIKGEATITDKQTVKDILGGKMEVSMGYEVELDESPGIFNGEKFDVVQRNIVHNHMAIVDRGRAGPEVRLRLDGVEAVQVDDKQTEDLMKIKVGKKEFDVQADLAEAIKAQFGESEELTKKLSDAETQIVELKKGAEGKTDKVDKAELDKLQAKNDALTEENKKLKENEDKETISESKVRELARGRTKLVQVAARVLPEAETGSIHDMDDQDLKKKIVKVDCPDVDFDGKSDVYVDARYDIIAEKTLASKTANDKAGEVIAGKRKKDGENADGASDYEANKAAYQDKASNRWKSPVGRQSDIKTASTHN